MKTAILIFAAAFSIQAQVSVKVPFSVIAHPRATFHRAPGDVWLRRASVAVLEAVNYADYETTYRGVIHGPYCEQNPLFRLPGCRINAPRFTGVKIAVAAFGLAQEVPEFAPAFRSWRWRQTYERGFTFLNIGVSVPLGIAVGNNIRVLKGGGKQ